MNSLNSEMGLVVFHPAKESSFTLEPGQIHVWRVALELTEIRYRELELWLSEDERARARRFAFDRDRARFVACRCRLRALLARYLSSEPHRIQFRYGARGKPSLKPAPDPLLFFNVSHSQDLALIALRRSGELGVDVEQLRPIAEAEAIARRYFTAGEHAALATLPADERIAAFFRCWTRKEAMLKATGEGMALSLDSFEVSLAQDERPRVLAVRGSGNDDAASWRLYHLEPDVGHIGAVAAQGEEESIIGWEWTDSA